MYKRLLSSLYATSRHSKHNILKYTTTFTLTSIFTHYTLNNTVYAADIEYDANGRPCRACTNNDLFKNALKQTLKRSETKHTNVLPCPADLTQLGNSTWLLLHTMTVYYPEQPTPQQIIQMKQFITGLSQFFPCHVCASHLQQYIQEYPIQCNTQSELVQWMCDMHNDVNQRLGKDLYDCKNIQRQYYDNDDQPCIDENGDIS